MDGAFNITLKSGSVFGVDISSTIFVIRKPELQESYTGIRVSGQGQESSFEIDKVDLIAVYKSGTILVVTNGKDFKFYVNSNLFLTGK